MSSLSLRSSFLSPLHCLSCTFTAFIPFFFFFLSSFPPSLLLPHSPTPPSPSSSPPALLLLLSVPVSPVFFDGVIFRDNKARRVRAPSILYGDRHEWYFQRCPKFRVESRFARSEKMHHLPDRRRTCAHSLSKHDLSSPPAAFPIHLLLLPKKKSTLLSGKSSRTYAKQFIFRLTAQRVVNYAVHFFVCVCVCILCVFLRKNFARRTWRSL